MVKKNKKEQSGKKNLIISIIVVALVILIVVISIVVFSNSSKQKPLIENNSLNTDDENEGIVDQVVEDVKDAVLEETCEQKVNRLTPDRIVLLKNSLDPLWSFDPKNTTINAWTDGKVLIPERFIRYQLSTGNVYKAEKTLIKNPHYYVYESDEVKFEINPVLKEETDTLVITEGFGGRMFYSQEFSIDDIGLIYCQLKNN